MKSEASQSWRPGKSWLLILIPPALTVTVSVFIVYPWSRRIDLMDPPFASLARLNSAIWLLVLWWSFHHLLFQIATLLRVSGQRTRDPYSLDAQFVILYLTCDDFKPAACESCLSQEYRTSGFRVLICDDSCSLDRQGEIIAFANLHPEVRVVRRANRAGFKAGNLNFAFSTETHEHEDWIVIVDADQRLPREYLSKLATIVAAQPEDVAFVQTANEPAGDSAPDRTLFQRSLEAEIRLFYERDLALRQKFGFLPALGHGLAVRRSAWQKLGGFPELVSEDYAFSLRISRAGLRGIYAPEITSFEEFPRSFEAFAVRLRKFAGGTAELFCQEVWRFLKGPSSIVEKVDFAMLLFWYPLAPLILLNCFLSSYVCGRWWSLEISALHPVLPYIFLTMFLLSFPVIASAAEGWRAAVRYWFWATAVYSCTLPLGAWHFLVHLFRRPTFERTPKQDGELTRLGLASLATFLLGILAIFSSLRWLSPFSPVLAAYGTAYAGFPFFRFLNREGIAGRAARSLIWLPGGLLLLALYTMWTWGSI